MLGNPIIESLMPSFGQFWGPIIRRVHSNYRAWSLRNITFMGTRRVIQRCNAVWWHYARLNSILVDLLNWTQYCLELPKSWAATAFIILLNKLLVFHCSIWRSVKSPSIRDINSLVVYILTVYVWAFSRVKGSWVWFRLPSQDTIWWSVEST